MQYTTKNGQKMIFFQYLPKGQIDPDNFAGCAQAHKIHSVIDIRPTAIGREAPARFLDIYNMGHARAVHTRSFHRITRRMELIRIISTMRGRPEFRPGAALSNGDYRSRSGSSILPREPGPPGRHSSRNGSVRLGSAVKSGPRLLGLLRLFPIREQVKPHHRQSQQSKLSLMDRNMNLSPISHASPPEDGRNIPVPGPPFLFWTTTVKIPARAIF